MARHTHWWQRGIIYQIYPRSFMDGNGDGIGDLAGIAGRLDYLEWLGVDAVWLSPFYPSPMADFGYDVSNYVDVHPMFGTLGDFDRLVAEAHRRGLRVIVDFVPNHTSDEHPWFQESRSSRDNPKRDWYVWRDPAPDGGPPNNWLAIFGGSAWDRDAASGQYYYHAFLPQQPDLNWRNPEVRRAMLDVLRFWLDRGVDGFRFDAVWHLIEDDQFRDNPPNPDYQPGEDPYHALLPAFTGDLPETRQAIAELRALVNEYDERVMIGEIYLPIERLVAYYGSNGTGFHLPANFQLILQPWDAGHIGAVVDRYEAALPPGAWPNWVLGNHDKPRVASRIGAGQARVAAVLLLTLRGTPTLYYGDELGMRDVEIPPARIQDPVEHRVPGLGLGRDPERTPMQWDGGRNAGFTQGTPWLPLAPDAPRVNVAAERNQPGSMLTLYRRLIALRRTEPALAVGSFAPVLADGNLLGYRRELDGTAFLVALNFGATEQRFVPRRQDLRGRIELSTHLDRAGQAVDGAFRLRGNEAVVVRLNG